MWVVRGERWEERRWRRRDDSCSCESKRGFGWRRAWIVGFWRKRREFFREVGIVIG